MCFWDTIITFCILVPLLIYLFYQSLKDISHTEIVNPVAVDIPPISNRQF